MAIQAKRENGREDLQVICTSLLIETLLDPCTHRPESMQIIRFLHQRRRHGGVNLRRRQPLVTHLFLNHGHRHACHQRIHHMAVPEDMGRDLPSGELLPARNVLNPASSARRSMVRSTVLVHRCPELRPGKSHTWQSWMLFRMACKRGLTTES